MKTEQDTRGPRERRFEMRVNIIGCIYLLSAMAVVIFVPHKIRGDVFLPWFLILCGGIVFRNRRLIKLRREEQTR
jgi:hypothetical protein